MFNTMYLLKLQHLQHFFFNERFQVTVVTNIYALKLKMTESVTVPITAETFFKPVVL